MKPDYHAESRLSRGEVVLFRLMDNDEVIAIFPELPGDSNPNTCLSYMIVGQHGACDKSLITELNKAKLYDAISMIEELQSLGYELIMPEYGLESIKNWRIYKDDNYNQG